MTSKPTFSAILPLVMSGVAFAAAPGGVTTPLVLAGKPFPEVARFAPSIAKPVRTRFVKAGKDSGDGSEAHPGNDLQKALNELAPGDRLRVAAGTYNGPFRIEAPGRDGEKERPIEVSLDPKATIVGGKDGPAIVLRRSHWILTGGQLDLGESTEPGLAIEGASTRAVSVNRVRIFRGSGPGLSIRDGASDVTVSNSEIGTRRNPKIDSLGAALEITGAAARVRIVNNRLLANRHGSIHVLSAREVELRGNTIRGDPSTAISIEEGTGVVIADNTIESPASGGESRAIELDEVESCTVRTNQISQSAVALVVGRADPKGGAAIEARSVTVDHNHFESSRPDGVAADVEAGREIRIVNNVTEGFASGILVLGRRPTLQSVTVANNLFLGMSETAFALADPASAARFDFNVFSPAVYSVNVEVGSRKLALVHFLKEKTMPNSRFVQNVRIVGRDLARVEGVETVDRGTPVSGIDFQGKGPDLGVAEQER